VVREQWIDRLRRDFLDGPADASEPSWISRDPESPGWLTVSTYQSLSSVYRRCGEAELAARLQAAGVSVLVADEAHHLRAVWWRCLGDMKRRLGSPVVGSLTATPPYDVPQADCNHCATLGCEV